MKPTLFTCLHKFSYFFYFILSQHGPLPHVGINYFPLCIGESRAGWCIMTSLAVFTPQLAVSIIAIAIINVLRFIKINFSVIKNQPQTVQGRHCRFPGADKPVLLPYASLSNS
jgi:hypothetical protein